MTSTALCLGAATFVAQLREDLGGCEHTLDAQFMTFEGDESGAEFAELLVAKARAGVRVRMLLDHYSDVIADDILPCRPSGRRRLLAERTRTRELLAHLERNGVAIRRTAPPGRCGRFLFFRDHKKLVVLDGRVAFVGGINVSDHNYAWHDFMARVTGTLAADVARDFSSTWGGTTVALGAPAGQRDFVVNQCAGRLWIFEEVLRMIDGARTSIAIESPTLLGERIEERLLRAARRGVSVTIVVPQRHNRVAVRIWRRRTLIALDHPRIAIHGFRAHGGMTHAKALVVDGARATFGSFNMFELESVGQKELNVVTSDPRIVRELADLVEADARSNPRLVAPRCSLGCGTYSLLLRALTWWAQRLLRDPEWRAVYC